MLFPTHLVVAWMLGGETRLSSAWLVAGAAVPDLVDKPLAMFGVVDLFHTVGHSALLGVLFVWLAYRSKRGLALGIGWASHLLLDAGHVILNGRPLDAMFLGWPLVVPPDPMTLGPVPFLLQYLYTPSFWIETGIWAAAVWVVFRTRREPSRVQSDVDGA